MEEIPFSKQEPIEGVDQLPGALLHEGRGGMRGDAGNMDTPGGQLHHHQHIITNGVSGHEAGLHPPP